MVEITKEKLLLAINNSAGIINNIAKRLNISWHTCKKLIDEYEEAKNLLSFEIQKNIDKAENVIQDALDNNDIQTAKWYLSTIGKSRGYSEKIDIEHEIKGDLLKKFASLFFENNK